MPIALGEDAIGVILSGTGHDGALGLKAIKARGGLTLAQGANGTAPEYPGMPESAVATGAVDLHVAVEEMPAYILAARQARLAALPDTGQPRLDVDRIRPAICDVLRSRLGHDFSQYKFQTFMRRVQRRTQVLRLTSYDDYIALLEGDRTEVVLLFRDLLISVTRFFRDIATSRHRDIATPRRSRRWKGTLFRNCSKARTPPVNCGSGYRVAPRGRRLTLWRYCCASTWTRCPPGRGSRYSPATSMRLRLPLPARAAIRRLCWRAWRMIDANRGIRSRGIGRQSRGRKGLSGRRDTDGAAHPLPVLIWLR
jgi:hypothetical protein